MNKTELQELITKASFNKKQQDAVNALLNKIFSLEQEVQSLQGVLATSKHVSSMLQIQLDNQEAYSRRPCLVISGVDSQLKEEQLNQKVVDIIGETGVDGEIIQDNIDKLHSIGKKNDNRNTQSVIVKFKTHSFKEKVYRKRNTIKNTRIKLRPSLTKRRQDLLDEVNKCISESTDPDLPVKFAFPDVHGTLKVLMKEGITPKFQTFNSIIEYYGILNKIGFTDPTTPGYMGEFE